MGETEEKQRVGGHPGDKDSFSRRGGRKAVPDASENSRKVGTEMDPWHLERFRGPRCPRQESWTRGGDRGLVSVNQREVGREKVETARAEAGLCGKKARAGGWGGSWGGGLFLFVRRETLKQSNLGSSSE